MCRWLAYYGSPLALEELLFKPAHSLIDRSLHSRLGVTTTNGDGCGVGWYATGGKPLLFRSTEPAWHDRNMRELFFCLALTFGLEHDPPAVVERAVGFIENVGRAHYPDNPVFQQLSRESRLVVSEPLSDLGDTWNEVPDASYGVIQQGADEPHAFAPRMD
jgi:predicted glutamine amidotransferase